MKTRLLMLSMIIVLSISISIVFPINTVLATQFIIDASLHPESDESRDQLERYCALGDKPSLKDELFYNNSTHFLSSKSCTWQELPVCGARTVFVDGVCQATVTEKPSQGDCLIATASYGSELAPQVQMLREIRDNTLLNTESGKIFMSGFNTIYYSFSPTIAQWENDNPIFKEFVKLFITPMISTLSIMTLIDNDSEFQVILFGISTIGLIVGMYIVAPTVAVNYAWRKRK